jgi:excisionase family DNA binding protein
MKATPPGERPAGDILTLEELANWLQIKEQTIYRMRHDGHGPPGVKVGKQLRFRVSDIDRWWNQRLRTAA